MTGPASFVRVETTPSAAAGHATFWVSVAGRLVCTYGEGALRTSREEVTTADRWLHRALEALAAFRGAP